MNDLLRYEMLAYSNGMLLEGGCYCGFVRYRLTAEPMFVNCCHCRNCQKTTGSAFAINAMVEAHRVEVISKGKPVTTGDTAKEIRCPKCCVLLWATLAGFGNSILFLRAGTLDEGEQLQPSAHFFTSRKHPWVMIPSDMPKFTELPGPDDPPMMSEESRQRLAAAMGRG